MRRRLSFLFYSIFLFLLVMSTPGFSVAAMGKTENSETLQSIKPPSCQDEIIVLQNMIHAANQSIESLIDENKDLRDLIERIRNELNRGGYGDFQPTLKDKEAR